MTDTAELLATLPDAVRAAAEQLAGIVLRTPTLDSPALTALSGARVVLKFENMQVTGSFKARGAYVRMAALDPAQRQNGVIAASAGNHAQGVAIHARRLGIPATIVMPKGTPFTKVTRTEALGATVVLKGAAFTQSEAVARDLAGDRDLFYVHPFDDPHIIAGQGTVGLEMLEDLPDLDVLVVPVGGGGLIAGIAAIAKDIKPAIEVIGVQVASFDGMTRAVKGEAPDVAGTATVAEGIAVKTPGRLTRGVVRALVDDMVRVDEAEIEHAMQVLLEEQKTVTEGAGAAALAGMLRDPDRFAGRRVGLVLSGGNVSDRLLSSVLLRSLVRKGRLVRMLVLLYDAPGNLGLLAAIVGATGANIIEVHHQRLFYDVHLKQAEVDLVVETMDADHAKSVIAALTDGGFPTRPLGSSAEDG